MHVSAAASHRNSVNTICNNDCEIDTSLKEHHGCRVPIIGQ